MENTYKIYKSEKVKKRNEQNVCSLRQEKDFLKEHKK